MEYRYCRFTRSLQSQPAGNWRQVGARSRSSSHSASQSGELSPGGSTPRSSHGPAHNSAFRKRTSQQTLMSSRRAPWVPRLRLNRLVRAWTEPKALRSRKRSRTQRILFFITPRSSEARMSGITNLAANQPHASNSGVTAGLQRTVREEYAEHANHPLHPLRFCVGKHSWGYLSVQCKIETGCGSV